VAVVGAVTTATAQNAQAGQAGQGGGGAQAGQGGGGTQGAVIPVVIHPVSTRLPASLNQAPVQVTITEAEDKDVLAVPVTALLAQPGGGYAVRTADGRLLIPVAVGPYDDVTGLVEVSGPRLTPGLPVQVAQP
jgi:hypothetical protein